MHDGLQRALLAAACVLLTLGTLAGVVNREVLDGSRFAAHADTVRKDAHVSDLVGVAISDQLIKRDQNLVALRPAIEAVTASLVRSSTFTPIVESAVRQVHESLTQPGSKQVLLRLADVSAVLVAALKTLAPDIAASVPPDLDVRLADVGSQTFAARTLHLTRTVGLLALLLPLLALVCLGMAMWLSDRRQRALAHAGLTIAASGVIVGIACVVASLFASAGDTKTLQGALISAAWRDFGPAFWAAATILLVAGCVVFAAAAAHLPRWSVAAIERRVVDWIRDPSPQPRQQLASGAILIVVGAAALFRPLLTAQVVVVLTGLAVLAAGISRISGVSANALAESEPENTSRHALNRRWVPRTITVLGIAGLIAYLGVTAVPANRHVPANALSSTKLNRTGCNGYTALCSRSYDKVAYVATHNSMSAADEPGWFIPEQPTGIIGQLDAGVRALLIDTWYGRSTDRAGVVTNVGAGKADGLAQARAEYGKAVVDSALRVRSALDLTPHGSTQPYLCHAVCELGSTRWLPVMREVRGWLAAHPREVVTFIIEDSVSPDDTAKIFEQAGLMPYVHTQTAGKPWPTLGEMVSSGKRIVVFMQRQSGGTAHPWLLKAWDWIQDTLYDNPSQAALSCKLLRGSADDSLFLITNIITRFATRVTDSERLNAFDALFPYAGRCKSERGLLPNFLAVDYFDKGSVFAVVNRLNGVG
jgi:hypothetical protein